MSVDEAAFPVAPSTHSGGANYERRPTDGGRDREAPTWVRLSVLLDYDRLLWNFVRRSPPWVRRRRDRRRRFVTLIFSATVNCSPEVRASLDDRVQLQRVPGVTRDSALALLREIGTYSQPERFRVLLQVRFTLEIHARADALAGPSWCDEHGFFFLDAGVISLFDRIWRYYYPFLCASHVQQSEKLAPWEEECQLLKLMDVIGVYAKEGF